MKSIYDFGQYLGSTALAGQPLRSPSSLTQSEHIEWDVVKGTSSHEGPDVAIFQSTFAAWDMLALVELVESEERGDKGFEGMMV